ncbi:MAG: adenine deaminase [Theionarchaea archaeon]|nr:adenine deaminase [Theionarchaea archaeon]MBU7038312.1 adenine deaminase [Theionarchaea archaeon]
MDIKGILVNVFTGDMYPVQVEFSSRIISIKKINEESPVYILPGFIDSHIHIESSMLCPSRFAEAVVPRGTTCTVSDPHEIANVMGMAGVAYMMEDTSVLKVYYTAPSCVPATAYETAGAVLTAQDIKELFTEYGLIALGEVMNYPAVVQGDKAILGKIEMARQCSRPIDGHAPGLSGEPLQKYLYHGISTDHECTTYQEAQEKQNLGMRIMIREGTASKNLTDLLGLKYETCFLVSDDLHPEDLKKGHIDTLLKKAVSHGIDPVTAVKMVTINPASHYKLNAGAIAPGREADIVIVDNLKTFSVRKVFIDGVLVAQDGKPLFSASPTPVQTTFRAQKKLPEDFAIPSTGGDAALVRVIRITEDQLYTAEEQHVVPCSQGRVLPDTPQDILKLVVVERYGHNRIGKGFVKGFGLQRGAIATSVAHDSHNIVAAGVSDTALAQVVNAIIECGGGIVACDKTCKVLELPVAGLMSHEPLNTVAEAHRTVQDYAGELGCVLQNPFMHLSFLALLVIPELKLSDRGLFDVRTFSFVDVIV